MTPQEATAPLFCPLYSSIFLLRFLISEVLGGETDREIVSCRACMRACVGSYSKRPVCLSTDRGGELGFPFPSLGKQKVMPVVVKSSHTEGSFLIGRACAELEMSRIRDAPHHGVSVGLPKMEVKFAIQAADFADLIAALMPPLGGSRGACCGMRAP